MQFLQCEGLSKLDLPACLLDGCHVGWVFEFGKRFYNVFPFLNAQYYGHTLAGAFHEEAIALVASFLKELPEVLLSLKCSDHPGCN